MNPLSIADLRSRGMIIYETLSGSRAYGLDTPESDKDIKGVFVLPRERFYGLDYIPQVSDERNDIVFYELKRFVELLEKNNPNLLEMLFVEESCIITKHPLFDRLNPGLFLSRLCRDTFAGYAMGQIKKARGLNKKILNPMEKEKKSLLDFCRVLDKNRPVKVPRWLEERGWDQSRCGLSALKGMKNLYVLYYDPGNEYSFEGLIKSPGSMTPALSSIPEGLLPAGILYCNTDAYSRYCREYGEYWNWVAKRNEARYRSTINHGKNYDAKNMMHTFRLLEIAGEIARTGTFTTRRPNREELLAIKRGELEYDDLMQKARDLMEKVDKQFRTSPLPPEPDRDKIHRLLVELRCAFYAETDNSAPH